MLSPWQVYVENREQGDVIMQIGKTSNGVLNHAKPQIQTQQITMDRLKLQCCKYPLIYNVKSEYFYM